MFENEDGVIECVGCGRRIRIRPEVKILARGDTNVNHRWSSFGLTFGVEIEPPVV